MEYATISETILLSYEQTKIAVYEETKELFEDAPMLLELWHQDAYQTSDDERLQKVKLWKKAVKYSFDWAKED